MIVTHSSGNHGQVWGRRSGWRSGGAMMTSAVFRPWHGPLLRWASPAPSWSPGGRPRSRWGRLRNNSNCIVLLHIMLGLWYAMTFAMMYECDLASGSAKNLFSSMLVFDEANNRVGQRGLVSAPHCYDSLGCVLLISTFPSDPSPRGCNLHMINIACLDKSAVGPTSSQGSELYNKYR